MSLADVHDDGIEFAPELPKLEPFALTLAQFITAKSETPAALIGDERENLLPAAGLLILFAKGGKGKTTLTVDAALHLASGVDWLGFPVENPMRVLLLENEGPREPFRAKLELKRKLWPHEIPGELYICTFDWGALNLADTDHADRLRDFIEINNIDLVIGDPLDSLGIDGVGSPEDTRAFVNKLVQTGLGRTVAFWLLHHARKDAAEDELDAISGSWGGKPDTMLMLEKRDGNRARLSFPKIRWSRVGTRHAYILAFDPDTESFTVAAEEQDEERDYLTEIEELLADGTWRTAKEIAAPQKNDGIGANSDTVKRTLEKYPDKFASCNGKDVGRSGNATVWQLTRAAESVESVGVFSTETKRTDLLTSPIGEVSRVESVPSETVKGVLTPESAESVHPRDIVVRLRRTATVAEQIGTKDWTKLADGIRQSAFRLDCLSERLA